MTEFRIGDIDLGEPELLAYAVEAAAGAGRNTLQAPLTRAVTINR